MSGFVFMRHEGPAAPEVGEPGSGIPRSEQAAPVEIPWRVIFTGQVRVLPLSGLLPPQFLALLSGVTSGPGDGRLLSVTS